MALDQLLATNIFSRVPGGVRREFVPYNDALTTQAFAQAINSGKMSADDAWRHFWTYKEDAQFWGLPQDKEWRTMLPDYGDRIEELLPQLNTEGRQSVIKAFTNDFLCAAEHFQFDYTGVPRAYIPSAMDMWAAITFEHEHKICDDVDGYKPITEHEDKQFFIQATSRAMHKSGRSHLNSSSLYSLVKFLRGVHCFAFWLLSTHDSIQRPTDSWFSDRSDKYVHTSWFTYRSDQERWEIDFASRSFLKNDRMRDPEDALKRIFTLDDDTNEHSQAVMALYEQPSRRTINLLQNVLTMPTARYTDKWWAYIILTAIHQHLKPQGYDSRRKKLVIPDVA